MCNCIQCTTDDWRYPLGAFRDQERLRYVPCEHCHGTGEIIVGIPPRHAYDEPSDYGILCSACDGYGMECVETESAGIEHTENT